MYGGSVIRVELQLGRRDSWGTKITGSVARWRDGEEIASLDEMRGAQVDLVKVTVRNLGRTAATIHDVGLRVGRPPVPRGPLTVLASKLLEPGVTAQVTRIEAHDAKEFYFYGVPIVRVARQHLGDGAVALRSVVMTGVGKEKVSPRWRKGRWNVWVVRGLGDRSILDLPLTTREQARLWTELTAEVWTPSILWVRQIADEAARLVDAGAEVEAAFSELVHMYEVFPAGENRFQDEIFMRSLLEYLIARRSDASL